MLKTANFFLLIILVTCCVGIFPHGCLSVSDQGKTTDVFIVDRNRDSFKIWTDIVRKESPKKQYTVIHVDAMPDLFPSTMTFERGTIPRADMLEKLEIGDNNFLWAGIWSGFVKKILWIHPMMSADPREHEVEIGIDPLQPTNDKFRISFDNLYFNTYNISLLEPRHIHDKVKVVIQFIGFADLLTFPDALRKIQDNILLDIDMNFVSNRNAFYDVTRRYLPEQLLLELLGRIAATRSCPDQDHGPGQKRSERILRTSFLKIYKKRLYMLPKKEFLMHTKKLSSLFCEHDNDYTTPELLYAIINNLFIRRFSALSLVELEQHVKIFCESIMEAGLFIHSPEYDFKKIETMTEKVTKIMKMLKSPPNTVTLSRSVETGSCPLESWPIIERNLLKSLKVLFSPTIHYDKDLKTLDNIDLKNISMSKHEDWERYSKLGVSRTEVEQYHVPESPEIVELIKATLQEGDILSDSCEEEEEEKEEEKEEQKEQVLEEQVPLLENDIELLRRFEMEQQHHDYNNEKLLSLVQNLDLEKRGKAYEKTDSETEQSESDAEHVDSDIEEEEEEEEEENDSRVDDALAGIARELKDIIEIKSKMEKKKKPIVEYKKKKKGKKMNRQDIDRIASTIVDIMKKKEKKKSKKKEKKKNDLSSLLEIFDQQNL